MYFGRADVKFVWKTGSENFKKDPKEVVLMQSEEFLLKKGSQHKWEVFIKGDHNQTTREGFYRRPEERIYKKSEDITSINYVYGYSKLGF